MLRKLTILIITYEAQRKEAKASISHFDPFELNS